VSGTLQCTKAGGRKRAKDQVTCTVRAINPAVSAEPANDSSSVGRKT
jgi:hypothetical protein